MQRMINSLSAIQLSATFCTVQVARFVFTTCSPCTVNVHTPATSHKHLLLWSSPTPLVVESSVQSEVKVLLIVHTWYTVTLNYILNRHSKYKCQIKYL